LIDAGIADNLPQCAGILVYADRLLREWRWLVKLKVFLVEFFLDGKRQIVNRQPSGIAELPVDEFREFLSPCREFLGDGNGEGHRLFIVK
jgi:hypothetical protein